MVAEFDEVTLGKAKSHFRLYGSITKAAKKLKVDRTTISRVVKNGTGEERVVKAVTKYVSAL